MVDQNFFKNEFFPYINKVLFLWDVYNVDNFVDNVDNFVDNLWITMSIPSSGLDIGCLRGYFLQVGDCEGRERKRIYEAVRGVVESVARGC